MTDLVTLTARYPIGGSLATAPTVTPGGWSMMEQINTLNNGTNTRFWKFVAAQDGAIRADARLSHPGPRALNNSNVMVGIYKQNGASLEELVLVGNIEYVMPGGGGEVGAVAMVEAGETYWVMARPWTYTSVHMNWGVVVRIGHLKPAEDKWWQVPERVVTRYGLNPADGWQNTTPTNPWDTGASTSIGHNSSSIGKAGIAGEFEWNQSFHGLDPIHEIPGYLAVAVPWQLATSGGDAGYWAAPGFSGEAVGAPGVPPFEAARYGGGGPGAWSRWQYSENNLGPLFQYIESTFTSSVAFIEFSLTHEQWITGARVGWTEDEMIEFAGVDPNDAAGIILEDDLPEIRRVWIQPDWTGAPPSASTTAMAPTQWWGGITRFDPDFYWASGDDPPAAAGRPWGPTTGAGSHPDGDFIQAPQYVVCEASDGHFPHTYIDSMGQELLGIYTGGPGVAYEVPREMWEAALEVEEHMQEVSVINDEIEELYGFVSYEEIQAWVGSGRPFYSPHEFEQMSGLTFMIGIAESLAPVPMTPGVPAPSSTNTSHAKGMATVHLWPKVLYRPSRFKVVLIPPLQPVEPSPFEQTAPVRRQEFEPIAHD